MRYYPVYLNLNGRRCLVAGAGRVAVRKIDRLLACGAQVTVVARRADAAVQRWAHEGRLRYIERPFVDADLDGVFYAVAATDHAETNRRLAEQALQRGILCNVADRPGCGDVVLPAVVRRDDLVITVSTSGKSPAFAAHLRKELETRFGSEYAEALQIAGAVRGRLQQNKVPPAQLRAAVGRLLDGGLVAALRSGDRARVRSIVDRVLQEYDLQEGIDEIINSG